MQTLSQSIRLFILLSIITGLIYPLSMTFIAHVAAPKRSAGDLIIRGDKVIGARLIAQKFTQDKYFWGRPSASEYDALKSGGSNLGPTSAKLKELVQARRANIVAKMKNKDASEGAIPSELLFASGSGLDPHIGVKTARFQVDRIALARGINEADKETVYKIIDDLTYPRQFGFIGNPYVNVLELNLALDHL